jgi:hypothetical protein
MRRFIIINIKFSKVYILEHIRDLEVCLGCQGPLKFELVRKSSSGRSQLGMFDIQATTKSKYYDHIVLLYLESTRCRYGSIIFACFYLYITVVIFIDYSDIDKMIRKMTEHFRPELFDDSVYVRH